MPKHNRTGAPLPISDDEAIPMDQPSLARKGLEWVKNQTAQIIILGIFITKIADNIDNWIVGRPRHIPAFTVSEFRHPTFWPEIFLITALLLWQDFFLGMGVYWFHFRSRTDLPQSFRLNIIAKSIIFFLIISGFSRPVMPPLISLGSIVCLWWFSRRNLGIIVAEVIAFIAVALRVTPERRKNYRICFDANVEIY